MLGTFLNETALDFLFHNSIYHSCLSSPAATFNECMAKRSKCGSGSL